MTGLARQEDNGNNEQGARIAQLVVLWACCPV